MTRSTRLLLGVDYKLQLPPLVDGGGREWLLQRAGVLRGLLAEEAGGLRGLVPAEEGQLEGGGVQSCQTGQSQFIL